MENLEKIKVAAKIKPIHFKNRKPVELIIGNDYYVSFGMNEASKCTLAAIEKDPEKIIIEIPDRATAQRGYIDSDGKFFYYTVSAHSLFPDEIGRTPEEAVINQVTS